MAEGSMVPRTVTAQHIDVLGPGSARVRATPPRPAPGDEGRVHAVVWIAGAAALLVAIVLRVRVIAGATLPVIMPDEGGTWSIARLLARVGPPIPMRDLPAYPMGTGVLLAPVVRLVGAPVAQYRAGLALLAVLVLLAAGFTTLFVRRLGIRDQRAVAACFLVALLLPAVGTTSSFTWSEALCAAALTGFLLAAQSAFGRVLGPAPVLAGLVAGAMPFVHARFSLVPACWLVCILTFLARSSRLERGAKLRTALLTVAATVLAYGAGRRAYAETVRRLWSDAPSPSDLLWDSLLEPGFWRQFAQVLIGQAWYLTAASFGGALLGALWLASAVARRRTASGPVAATVVTTSLVLVAVFLTSAAPIASGTYEKIDAGQAVRGDYFVYGRYLDCVAMVLAGLGVASLFALADGPAVRRRVAAVLVTLGALTAVVWVTLPDERLTPFAPNIAGVSYLPFSAIDLDIVRWTIIAALAFLVVVVSSRLASLWSLLLLGALFAAGSIGASSAAMSEHDRWLMEPLHVDVPPPGDRYDTVVVADDIERARTYEYASLVQEYVLTDRGWGFDFTPLSSAELQARDPERAGVMVLVREQAVDEDRWRLAGELGEARVWVRRET